MQFKKLTFWTITTLLCTLSHAEEFSACLDYFPNKTVPKLIKPQQYLRDLCFDSFAVMHSGQSKTPIYVVEKLNHSRIKDAADKQRTDHFYPEARLPSAERAQLEDYKGQGYDRGHMAPAADMPTPNAMAQSFSLANMVPQAPENNRGIWAKSIEKPVRQYAMRASSDIFVFTGPVFDAGDLKTIGVNKVWVPTYLYKLVFDPAEGKAFAYWIENKNDARMSALISYTELVQRVGIDFLPGIYIKLNESTKPIKKAAPTTNADTYCHTGPQGGTYTIMPNGKKNYDGC